MGYPSCLGVNPDNLLCSKARMLHQPLMLTLMLGSALARGPICSDGVAPTCSCSDGTLPTCNGSPLVCPNGEEWVEGSKCKGRPRGRPACADSNVVPTCDDGSQPSFRRPGGRPGGRPAGRPGGRAGAQYGKK